MSNVIRKQIKISGITPGGDDRSLDAVLPIDGPGVYPAGEIIETIRYELNMASPVAEPDTLNAAPDESYFLLASGPGVGRRAFSAGEMVDVNSYTEYRIEPSVAGG